MPSILSPGSSSSSNSRSYTPLADEVNPPIGANVPTVTRNGTVVYAKRAHSDSSRSGSSTPIRGDSAPANHLIASRVAMMKANEEHTVSARRGKGKERAWDAEMGEEKEDSYPPMQETAEEERRIADNLARFAARDAARRRAARLSKQLPASPQSASSGFTSRPYADKRQSILGGIMSTFTGKPAEELPMTSPTKPYNNPYEDPVKSPPDLRADLARESISSSGSSPPGQGFAYGYVGPAWRSGAVQVDERARGEKWYHALCGWGEDLDGGFQAEDQDDQAGRTNPNE